MELDHLPAWQTRFSSELQQCASTCERCQHLADHHRKRFSDIEIGWGCLQTSTAEPARACPLCTFLYAVCRRQNADAPNYSFEELGSTGSLLDQLRDAESVSKITWKALSVAGPKPCIVPLDNSKPENAHRNLLAGRVIGLELDADLLVIGVRLCADSHGPKCQSESFNPARTKEIGLRMVDVKREIVIPAPAGYRYAALSYVWGEGSRSLLTNSTSRRLTRPCGLSGDHLDTPRTFVDVVLLARRLGFYYLWIDAVCIKQDDSVDMGKQMSSMDRIYARAALTIVSDAGSTHAGILGVRASSRDAKQLQYLGEHIELVALKTGPFSGFGLSP